MRTPNSGLRLSTLDSSTLLRTNSILHPQASLIYCNYQRDNWARLLPLAEFVYNNLGGVGHYWQI
ncbi:hypothetical protein OH77DRAFT_1432616 [Trametes cingulata]|nr:hypothetical protein OH77DRAFT_1432616 [Trametes cingulata]